MLAASVASSSESVGDSSTTRWKKPSALCASARTSISCSAGTSSRISSTSARRNGRYCVTRLMRKRWMPWTTRRSEPSGKRNILWMWVKVPIGYRSLSTGSSTAGSRWVTTPITLRSLTASLTSATELSRATASGRIACGNSSVSRSGSTPRSAGSSSRSTSCTPSDSKSGLRSSLIRSSVAAAGPQCHVDQLALQPLEGLGLARGADVVLRLLLAVPAQGRGRQLDVALLAATVAALLQALEREVDLLERLRLHLHQGQVDLLHEVVDALLLGIAHLGGAGRDVVAQRAQLFVDVAPAVLEDSLEQQVTLALVR